MWKKTNFLNWMPFSSQWLVFPVAMSPHHSPRAPSHTPAPGALPSSSPAWLTWLFLFACRKDSFSRAQPECHHLYEFSLNCPCMTLFHQLHCIEWWVHCPLPHQTVGCQKDRVVWFAVWSHMESTLDQIYAVEQSQEQRVPEQEEEGSGEGPQSEPRLKLRCQSQIQENFWPAIFHMIIKRKEETWWTQ